jgi:cobalt-zinc-cadmium efflux system outer membrane protein
VTVSQALELGGKRSARIRAFRADEAVAAQEVAARRLELWAQTKTKFIEVLYAQTLVKVSHEMEELASRAAGAVTEQAHSGKVSPLQENRARVALAMAGVATEQARRELAAARYALASLWAGREPDFSRAEGSLPASGEAPGLAELERLLLESPVLARARAQAAQASAAVRMEETRAVPNLTLRAGYRYLNGPGESALLVGFSLPLPLFDRNQGAVAVQRARLRQALDREEATRAALRAALALAQQRARAAVQELSILRERTLPLASEAYEGIQEGYRLGRFGFLEALDAQRTLFEARSQHLRARKRLARALVEIERWVGRAYWPAPREAAPPAQ